MLNNILLNLLKNLSIIFAGATDSSGELMFLIKWKVHTGIPYELQQVLISLLISSS